MAAESANEAGVMFVSGGKSDLFDLQFTASEKMGGSLQPMLNDEKADIQARVTLEQALEMSGT